AQIRRHRIRLDYIQAYTLDSAPEVQHPSGTVAQVHDPALNIGTTVVDPDNNPLPVVKVRHLDVGPERKLAMSRCQLEHVEVFPAGCGPAVKLFAVPGGKANLVGGGWAPGLGCRCLVLCYGSFG